MSTRGLGGQVGLGNWEDDMSDLTRLWDDWTADERVEVAAWLLAQCDDLPRAALVRALADQIMPKAVTTLTAVVTGYPRTVRVLSDGTVRDVIVAAVHPPWSGVHVDIIDGFEARDGDGSLVDPALPIAAFPGATVFLNLRAGIGA
jgi:hypothetical protein